MFRTILDHIRKLYTLLNYFGLFLTILNKIYLFFLITYPASGGQALQMTDDQALSSGAPLTTKEEEKNFPFHIMVEKVRTMWSP